MSDIVERLREHADMREAADEIDRLRAALFGIAEWSMTHVDAVERARKSLGAKSVRFVRRTFS